ncbi:MAG: serine/threonine protein kinase [Alphaproteobacteria bacterium]|nr:serine/threonine protein kinase [Alphaproteobacteria bacterium]
MILHTTSVALDGKAVLLAGPSGVGKSDVALRLIESGATLIADDQTKVQQAEGQIIASPPDSIAGLIEVRHVGLYKLPYVTRIPIVLYVDLVFANDPLDRLPSMAFYPLLDQPVRWLKLVGCEASTPSKIRIAMKGTHEDDRA